MKKYFKNITRCDVLFLLALMSIIGYFGVIRPTEPSCGCGE